MKKIISFSLIILIIIGMLVNGSYAEGYTYKTNLSLTNSSNNELSKDDTFVITVGVSGIQDERGIIALGGILEYEKDVLEIETNSSGKVEMHEIGEWKGLYYNKANGKFVIDRDRLYSRK